MSKPLRALLVEDSDDDAQLLLRELRRCDYEVTWERVQSEPAMRAALAPARWDIVLSDYSMPGFGAREALAVVKASGLDLPFIILSGTIGEEQAVEALKAGADDFLVKGRFARLHPSIERAMREAAARADQRRTEEALRQSEEQLRQAMKMEAVGRLAGGIAHDFNNLLSVVLSACTFLLEGFDEGKPLRSDVEDIQRAGERARELTRQLLAFGRRQVLQPLVIDLRDVVRGLESMLRRLIGEDVTVLLALPPQLGRVKADLHQIEQIIVNLVVNARDAMPDGGKLTLEVADVELDEAYKREHLDSRAGPHVMLAVSDTGVGMDRATQAKIFDPFFTTKGVGKGTGLGLSTVYGIVKQSGGSVWVYSEPGKGATFKVYFPRTEEAVEVLPQPHSQSAILRGNETVLVVEDEEPVRLVACTILQRYGYQVLEARNPKDAIELCRAPRRIDLLLTDVVMPEMGGRDLARAIQMLQPGIRVLYMSGYTDNAIVHHGLLDRGVVLLEKPITPDALARKVREVLDTAGSNR